jgi:hypothetical protein
MLPSLLLASALWSPLAAAGDVRVVTAAPVEVHLNGVPVVRTDAAGEVTLRDVEPGERVFVVHRAGGQQRVPVKVPAAGAVRLDIGLDGATTDSPGAAERPDAGPPTVTLVAAAGQRFSIVVDGARLGEVAPDAPLRLADLEPGVHAVQVRSTDQLTIWARGRLTLEPGDRIELHCEEGRMVRASGRDGAWKAR